jgi:hypothetical protein
VRPRRTGAPSDAEQNALGGVAIPRSQVRSIWATAWYLACARPKIRLISGSRSGLIRETEPYTTVGVSAASGEAFGRWLSAWALPGFALLAVATLVVGLLVDERRMDDDFVRRFRGRARYLRWLSMSCLALMGAMVSAGINAVQPGAGLGTAAVFGLVAAVLASVYRYIVRLAYFYEARADVFELLRGDCKPAIFGESGVTVNTCGQLLLFLAPETVEYSSSVDSLKKAVDAWSKDKR